MMSERGKRIPAQAALIAFAPVVSALVHGESNERLHRGTPARYQWRYCEERKMRVKRKVKV